MIIDQFGKPYPEQATENPYVQQYAKWLFSIANIANECFGAPLYRSENAKSAYEKPITIGSERPIRIPLTLIH